MQATITIIQARNGDSKSYNLSLDAGKLGTDNCVEMILKFRELMDAMK